MDLRAELVGGAPAMVALREQIEQVVKRIAGGRRVPPILLLGETGVGKTLVARLIHRAGARAAGPFVDVNCAAIPETLLEAELFGFERGAFTDARQAKPGLVESAQGGTILLDEIALLSEALQAKLLTVIEDRNVRRLGGTRSETVDVAIIAATNDDLAAAVRARRFREDLYHRLAVVILRVPPLRERAADIPVLAEHFLARACADYGLPPKRVTSRARTALAAHRWPGNVRELANVMERAALLSDGAHIDAKTLDLVPEPPEVGLATAAPTLAAQVEHLEREQLVHALDATRWNVVRAAAQLGITRAMLRYRIAKYGLAAPSRRAPRVAASPPTRWESRRVVWLSATVRAAAETTMHAEIARYAAAVEEKIESFGGRVEDADASQVVAAFGVEPAEDAARRAALAALAIENALGQRRDGDPRRVVVHVALHADDCLVTDTPHREVDAEARRRMSGVLDRLGESGGEGIVITASVRSLLSARFEIEDGDGAQLIGYRAQPFGPRESLAPFVGREVQLAMLRARWDDACRGRGQLVAVIGAPGIGKSRVLYELRSTLGGDVNAFEGRAESYAGGIPYYAIIDLLKRMFDVDEHDDPAIIVEKVTARVLAIEGAPAIDAAPLLALLEVPIGDAEWPRLEPSRRRQRTLDALSRLVAQLARERPTLLALEDLHWSDTETRAFLDRLLMSAASLPLMILVTYRPEFAHGWANHPSYTQIRLDALSAQTAETLLDALLGGDVSLARLKRLLVERTEGNPFFLEESVRTLVETHALSGARGAYRLERDVPALDVAPTVQAVLASRIDRLSADARRVLQTAAVIGRHVPLRVLDACVASEQDLAQRLMDLHAGEFLFESAGSPELTYAFTHALTHEVAYLSLSVETRRALHARIVTALERLYDDRLGEQVEILAHHAVHGELWPKAVAYLRDAGLKAFMRSANVDAVAAFTRGLDAVGRLADGAERDDHELRLLLALGPALQAMHGLGAPEAERVFVRARELSERLDQPVSAFRALWGQWMVDAGLGRVESSRRIGEALLQIAGRTNDPALELEAHHAMWATSFWLGDLGATRRHAERGIALYDVDAHGSLAFEYGGHDPGVCCRWFGAWTLWLVGSRAEAHTACEVAVALAERLAHPPTIAIALAWACGLSYFERDARTAAQYAGRLVALATEQSLPAWSAAGRIFHGWARGDADGRASLDEIREGLAGARAAGTLMPLAPLYNQVFADACLQHEAIGEGLIAADEALASMAQTGARVWLSEVHRLKGELLVARSSDDVDAADECFVRAIDVARTQEARSWERRALDSRARLSARRGADPGRRAIRRPRS